MLRTFSFEALAVVPTTQGLTSEIPSAGTDQEISDGENQVRERKRAAESQLIRDGPAKNREEPHHAPEDSREGAGLLCGETQLSLQIERQRGERAVIGEALEDFADVGDPERPLEAVANFFKPLAKAHDASRDAPGS